MDKTFLSCKEERVCVEKTGGGIALILSTLACICVAFTFMNMAVRLYSAEDTHGKLSEAVIVMSEAISDEDAIFTFLGLDENESTEIH